MKLMIFFTLIIFVYGRYKPQKPPRGFTNCEKSREMENFDVRNFTGKWFEIYSVPSCLTSDSRCVTTVYTINNSNIIKAFTKFMNENGVIIRHIIYIDYKNRTMFLKNQFNCN